MEYYCAMIMTGEETDFNSAALEAVKENFPEARFYFFQRKLFTKKRGWFTAPMFAGYVFFCVSELTPDFLKALKHIKGFCRILRDNQNPEKLTGSALRELELFMQNGQVWGVSKVRFVEGQKVKVVSGPLLGFEGNIVDVNRKNKQVTVQSGLTGVSMRFDLKFEEIDSIEYK